jgi:hypothetical protein
MDLEEAFVGRSPQPEAEGHRLAAEEIAEPAKRLELGFLDHIRRIEARPQPAVQAQLDDVQQLGPVAAEEPFKGGLITGAGLLEQNAGFFRVGCWLGHGNLLIDLPPKNATD